MCLTKIYPEKKIIKEGVGYKAFLSSEQGLLPCFYFSWDKKTLSKGKWLKEKKFRVGGENKKLITCYQGNYPFGFHLFKKRRDAKHFTRFGNFVIKKVKFRKGCAIGLNRWAYKDLETIVAKEIFIPESGK